MVAARMQRSQNAHPSASNVVRRTARDAPVVEARRQPRARVALQAWLCAESRSARGYALEVSAAGARFGGMGLSLRAGDRVLAKIVVDAAFAPLVLRAEVVRYAPCGGACPEVCVRFLDGVGQESVDEHFRLARFVDSRRNS